MRSLPDWLDRCSQEALASDRLATVIAQSGAAGVFLDRLRRIVGLPKETLQDLLRALATTGQVRLLKVGGEMVYRAAG